MSIHQNIRLSFLGLSLIIWFLPVMGQISSTQPYIRNYTPREYTGSAAIWEIARGKDGLMYFGNSNGVTVYNGYQWTNYAVQNNTTVRSLDVDSNGIIYIGAKAEFGYLKGDQTGKKTYYSLSAQLPDSSKNFVDVWNTYATADGVFFLTFKKIFRWYNDSLYVYSIGKLHAHLGFRVYEKLYIIHRGKGIMVFNKDQFETIPGGDHFIGKAIFAMMPYAQRSMLTVNRKDGLTLINLQNGEITPVEGRISDKMGEDFIYHGAYLGKGQFALGTLANGIYIINKDFKQVTHWNSSLGMQSDNIKYIFPDPDEGLWVGSGNGIIHLETKLPLTHYSKENGIRGNVRDIIRHRGTLYAATGNGIFYLDQGSTDLKRQFIQLEKVKEQVWAFAVLRGDLLAATGNGVYWINGLETRQMFTESSVFGIFPSKRDSNLCYLAMKHGVGFLKAGKNGISDPDYRYQRHAKIGRECDFIAEDKLGNVWVYTGFDSLIYIYKHSMFSAKGLKYKKLPKISNDMANEGFITVKNKVFFSSNTGLLSYSEQAGKDIFALQDKFSIQGLPAEAIIKKIKEDREGNIWIHYHEHGQNGMVMAAKTGENTYEAQAGDLPRINEKLSHINAIYLEDNGVSWIGGGEGLIKYDQSKDAFESRSNYPVTIGRVSLANDSVVFYGDKSNYASTDFSLPYTYNQVKFTFGLPVFSHEEANQYQYYLQGLDEKWSPWSSTHEKEYTNIPEGQYTFRVRAKNVYGQISHEDTFQLTVHPPWYRSVFAYIGYVILFLVLVHTIVRGSTRQLRKAKKSLESEVATRTREITQEKEKVEKMHQSLERRNRDILDSIKYALRIQNSILPPLSKLEQTFPENFVFFQPRDIVSGDFYWFERVGDYFILATVDCTGHGVPGAFMSMICATLIDKVVKDKHINSPEQALTILNSEVHDALNKSQTGEIETRDGMDIGLMAINTKTLTLQYAGAYRPLYLLRNKKLIEYPGVRFSVGGSELRLKKEFTGYEFSLASGDMLYLYTDGYTDQFGGEFNKKYKVKTFKQLLEQISDKPVQEQYRIIEKTFLSWKRDQDQTDDVLVMGIRIP